jgi:predicted HicB family RNase H-like nuclease
MKREGTTTAESGIMLRVDPKLKMKLLELATEDQRSLASFVEIVLQRYINELAEKRRERR